MTMRFITAVVLSMLLTGMRSEKPAYLIFTSEGKETNYSKMMKELQDADIIFYGELHDNPVSHWLELEITHDLFGIKKEKLILAAEMFETDNQVLINEYLSGLLTDARFEEEARLWGNYSTDYKPLLKFAVENKLHFVASNVPRRYASMVAKAGFGVLDTLSDAAKEWIAPLPVAYDPELKCYRDMLQMGHSGGAPVNLNLPKAQALKDATMAWSVLKAFSPGQTIIHFNGSYHSDWHQGIVWHIRQQRTELKISTIATVLQDEMKELNTGYVGQADFIIVVPSRMTRTY